MPLEKSPEKTYLHFAHFSAVASGCHVDRDRNPIRMDEPTGLERDEGVCTSLETPLFCLGVPPLECRRKEPVRGEPSVEVATVPG